MSSASPSRNTPRSSAGLDGAAGHRRVRAQPLLSRTPAPAGSSSAPSADCVRRIVALCRARTRLPLVAKLSPVLPDIAGMALVARDAGADGDLGREHAAGPAPRGWRACHRLGNGNGGVSGPVLLPIGVLAAARVVERTGGMPVIGVRRRAHGGRRPAVPPGRRLAGGDGHGGAGRPAPARSESCDDLERNRWLRSILALDLPTAPRRCGCWSASRRRAWVKVGSMLMTREGARSGPRTDRRGARRSSSTSNGTTSPTRSRGRYARRGSFGVGDGDGPYPRRRGR